LEEVMKTRAVIVSISLVLFGCTASSMRGQFSNEDELRNEDIKVASAALGEVRNYYLLPNKTHSCRPGPDSTTDKTLIDKILHPVGYSVEVSVLEKWFLAISFIDHSKNDFIGVSIKWQERKCVQFEIEQGYT